LGHYPLPFLISESQRTGAKMYWKIGTAKSFLKKLFKMSEALMKKATFLKMALSIPQRKNV
jgi:hypothetical protein